MLRDAGFLLGANLTRYAAQFALFTLAARQVGPSAAGDYALALAISAPFFIVGSLGQRTLFFTLRARVTLAQHERIRIVSLSLAALLSMAVAYAAAAPLALVGAAASIKILESLHELYGAALQRNGRLRFILINSIILSSTLVTVFFVTLQFAKSILVSLAIAAVAYGALTLLRTRRVAYFVALEATYPTSATHGAVRAVVPSGVALGLSAAVVTLLFVMPQYLLAGLGASEDVAKFVALTYLVVGTDIASNALSQAWLPKERKEYDQSGPSVSRVVKQVLLWITGVAPLGLIGVTIAYFAFPWLLGPSFTYSHREALPLLVAFLAGPLAHGSIIALGARGQYRPSLLANVLALLVSFALCVPLVRELGLVGALWGYAAGLGIRGLLGMLFFIRLERSKR